MDHTELPCRSLPLLQLDGDSPQVLRQPSQWFRHLMEDHLVLHDSIRVNIDVLGLYTLGSMTLGQRRYLITLRFRTSKPG